MKKIFRFFMRFFNPRNREDSLKTYPKYISNCFDEEIFEAINEHRKKLNLLPLEKGIDDTVDMIGAHVKWLYENTETALDVESKGHERAWERFAQTELRDKNITKVNECVAYNYSSGKGVVGAWSRSTRGHKEVLEGISTHVCIAHYGNCAGAIFYVKK